MLHFTRFNRLLNMTHLFEFSLLFRRQWRTSWSGNSICDYKRYLRFMKNVKTSICVFIITTDTLAHGKSLFCRNQTLNVVECHPGRRKTTKCRILVFFCVMRTCDSGDGINDLSALHKKHCSHIAFWHSLKPDLRLRGEETVISEVSVWLMFIVVL